LVNYTTDYYALGPLTCKRLVGEFVPIPTLPLLSILILSVSFVSNIIESASRLVIIVLPVASMPKRDPSVKLTPVVPLVNYNNVYVPVKLLICKSVFGVLIPIPIIPVLAILILSVLLVENIISEFSRLLITAFPFAVIPKRVPSVEVVPVVVPFVIYKFVLVAVGPFTCKILVGTDIPIPTLPPLSILILSIFVVEIIIGNVSRLLINVLPNVSIPKRVPSVEVVPVVVPLVNYKCVLVALGPLICKRLVGVDIPIPKREFVLSHIKLDDDVIAVPVPKPICPIGKEPAPPNVTAVPLLLNVPV
jgi:hypothetical protein